MTEWQTPPIRIELILGQTVIGTPDPHTSHVVINGVDQVVTSIDLRMEMLDESLLGTSEVYRRWRLSVPRRGVLARARAFLRRILTRRPSLHLVPRPPLMPPKHVNCRSIPHGGNHDSTASAPNSATDR